MAWRRKLQPDSQYHGTVTEMSRNLCKAEIFLSEIDGDYECVIHC